MNNAANFLQYVQTIQNPKMLLNNPNLISLKQKYNNPQQLAMQEAQRLGISPDQLNQIAKQLGIIQ